MIGTKQTLARCDKLALGTAAKGVTRAIDPASARGGWREKLVGRGRFRLFLLSRSALSCVDYEPESHPLYNDSSSRKSSRVTPRTALPSNRSELTTSSFSREKVLINQSNSNGEA